MRFVCKNKMIYLSRMVIAEGNQEGVTGTDCGENREQVSDG